MSASPEVNKLDSVKQHKRVTRRQIVLPVIGIGVILAGIVALLVIPFSPIQFDDTANQISIVSNIIVSIIVLCPIVLCLLLMFVLVVFMTLTVHKTHTLTAKQMRRLQVATRNTADKTAEMADKLSEQSIRYTARLGVLNPIFDIFDRPSKEQIDKQRLIEAEDKKDDDGTN